MEIKYFKHLDALSKTASEIIMNKLSGKPHLTLCTASGFTPTLLYNILADEYKKRPELFLKLNIVKLDEWGGVPLNHPQSCESYLQENVIKPLQITHDRFLSFNSIPENPEFECRRVQKELEEKGGIDICILGIGANGHIAFNEPADYLYPYCHVEQLSEKSLQHKMASSMEKAGLYGLTLGIANILQSKTILLLVCGGNKSDVTKEFLKAQISTHLPASLLWLHPHVICLVDEITLE